MERTLITADFDRIGNHFWTWNMCHAINKATLCIVLLVKIHLNTFDVPKIYLFQNRCQKFSWRMGCLGSCPWGKWREKVTCPRGNCTCPRQLDRVVVWDLSIVPPKIEWPSNIQFCTNHTLIIVILCSENLIPFTLTLKISCFMCNVHS